MAKIFTTDNNEFLPDGSTPNPNYGQTTVSGEDDPAPQPNNAGNPYFPGYVPKTQSAFWGLVQAVFIALSGSNATGADRFYRLTSSQRAAATVKIIQGVGLVDPDDKQGAFLREIAFLTTTPHETDNQPLMAAQEVGAIMQKSNWT